SALLAGMSYAMLAAGTTSDTPGTNLLDGGAPFYDSYMCADGKFVAIGSIEPQFYALLREKAGIADDADFDAQFDRAAWPARKEKLAAIFRTRTRDEWCAIMEMTDVCFAPVLSMAEAPAHPHNVARQTFVTVGGAIQPAPAPRFSATPAPDPVAAPIVGADNNLLG
ncbi:MAG: CoA transferase, partial [Sphingomonas sp.]|nr:CoA transferase [Sphingomonas sp.]